MTDGVKISEADTVEDLVGKLREAWQNEDVVIGVVDHRWASRLDESLTLGDIGKAFDRFSEEFPGIFPELDRCNLGRRVTRITFRRDYSV